MNQLKAEKYEMKSQVSKLEEEMKSLKGLLAHSLNAGRVSPGAVATNLSNSFGNERAFMRQSSNYSNRNSSHDRQKRHSLGINYSAIHAEDGLPLNGGENEINQEQLNELLKGEQNLYVNGNASVRELMNGAYIDGEGDLNDGTLVQMEKDNLELRRELQDALATKKQADKKILK